MEDIIDTVVKLQKEEKSSKSKANKPDPNADPYAKKLMDHIRSVDQYHAGKLTDMTFFEDAEEPSSVLVGFPLIIRILIKEIVVCLPIILLVGYVTLTVPHTSYNLLKSREGFPTNWVMEMNRYAVYFIILFTLYNVIYWSVFFTTRIIGLFIQRTNDVAYKPATYKVGVFSLINSEKKDLIRAIFFTGLCVVTRLLIIDNSNHYIKFVKPTNADETANGFDVLGFVNSPFSMAMDGLFSLIGEEGQTPTKGTSDMYLATEIPVRIPNYGFIYYYRALTSTVMVFMWLLFGTNLLIQFIVVRFHRNSISPRIYEMVKKLYVVKQVHKICKKRRGPIDSGTLEEGHKDQPSLSAVKKKVATSLSIKGNENIQNPQVNSGDTEDETKDSPNHLNPAHVNEHFFMMINDLDLFSLDPRVLRQYSGGMADKVAQQIYEFYSKAYTGKRVIGKLKGKSYNEVTYDDFRPYMANDMALDTAALFIPSMKTGASQEDIAMKLKNLYRERQDFFIGLGDRGEILNSLNVLLKCIIADLTFIIGSISLGFSPLAYIACMISIGVVCIFVIGDLAKEFILNFIYIFITHAYDVGDLVELDNNIYEVKKINLVNTTMKDMRTGNIVYYPTTRLTEGPLYNRTRAMNQIEQITLEVPSDTLLDDMWNVKSKLYAFLIQVPEVFTGDMKFNDFHIIDGKLSVKISITYITGFHDYRKRRYSTQILKTKILSLLESKGIECKGI